MNTTEILQKTEKLVNGDRDKTHGNKIINHENIARLWSAYLQNKMQWEAQECASCDMDRRT